jgi:3-dehydroquinate synthase
VREIEQRFAVSYAYPVVFTRDAFGAGETALLSVLRRAGPGPHRVLVAIDGGLLAADPRLPERLSRFGERHPDQIAWVAPPVVVPGGEVCKQDPALVERFHRLVEAHRIDRQSFFLVIGGGAVLDAVGYAAATAHRGVRLIRMPSTVLGQNDAGIGVKNAVNAFGRKNFVGSFAPPFGVVNDLALLATLPARDRISGIAEAVKVAVLKDAAFFDALHAGRRALAALEPEATEHMIVRCAELHLEHIRTNGDPFELGSARPLDFGHWSAHALEEVSDGALRHGEAVAIGVALDSLYAWRTGLLDELSCRRIVATLEDVGFGLADPALRWLDVEAALAAFREHLGGRLSITLPEAIGRARDVHEIDMEAMRACIALLLRRDESARRGEGLPHEGELSDVRDRGR